MKFANDYSVPENRNIVLRVCDNEKVLTEITLDDVEMTTADYERFDDVVMMSKFYFRQALENELDNVKSACMCQDLQTIATNVTDALFTAFCVDDVFTLLLDVQLDARVVANCTTTRGHDHNELTRNRASHRRSYYKKIAKNVKKDSKNCYIHLRKYVI